MDQLIGSILAVDLVSWVHANLPPEEGVAEASDPT
jgi:hypothetical protein